MTDVYVITFGIIDDDGDGLDAEDCLGSVYATLGDAIKDVIDGDRKEYEEMREDEPDLDPFSYEQTTQKNGDVYIESNNGYYHYIQKRTIL